MGLRLVVEKNVGDRREKIKKFLGNGDAVTDIIFFFLQGLKIMQKMSNYKG